MRSLLVSPVLFCAVNSRAWFNSTDQRCSSAHTQQDGHDTISCAIYYGPSYATAVKLAFGSPRDEEVLDGYIECDLLNNTSPGLALIV